MFVHVYMVFHTIHRLAQNSSETEVLSFEDKNLHDQLKLYSQNNGYFFVTLTKQNQKTIKLEYLQ